MTEVEGYMSDVRDKGLHVGLDCSSTDVDLLLICLQMSEHDHKFHDNHLKNSYHIAFIRLTKMLSVLSPVWDLLAYAPFNPLVCHLATLTMYRLLELTCKCFERNQLSRCLSSRNVLNF